jgi:hypothetical protein
MAGIPAPPDEFVVRVVLDNLRQRLAPISLRIFQLLADSTRTLSNPRHLARRDVPVMGTRDAGVSEVAILMATCALHPDHAAALGPSRHRRLVSDHLHAL